MEYCAAAALGECQTRADDTVSKLQENGEALATDVDSDRDSAPPVVVEEGVPTAIEASLERLLQRQRSELFFELRRLQYGDRPVTGQEQRRRTVENLVLRAVGPDTTGRRQLSTADRFSTSSRDTEVHRPEEILVEVNALVERRPVSSMLQSLAFRRSLENSVRGALQTIRNGPTWNAPVSRVAANATNDSSSSSERGAAVAGSLHGSTDRERSPSSLSLHSTNDLTASRLATESTDNVPAPPPPPSVPSVPVETLDNVAGTSRAGEWIQQHVPLHADPAVGHQMRVRDILDQMHHEELIVEISDLIHRQLVTSSLNGNFRNVLERRLRRHMDDSGIDGARVQEQLRRLPRSTVHMRNDFLDLGIMAPAQAAGGDGMAGQEQLDNMSVISATAAVALPQAYTQSNAAMSREIVNLKTELQELKNMMRLSFDLQLDIQRSIRQEVSAALAQRSEGASVSALRDTTADAGTRAADADSQCLICLERSVDTALYQCGHLCLCHLCAMQLRQNGSHCPVCRAPIRDIMRTYRP